MFAPVGPIKKSQHTFGSEIVAGGEKKTNKKTLSRLFGLRHPEFACFVATSQFMPPRLNENNDFYEVQGSRKHWAARGSSRRGPRLHLE